MCGRREKVYTGFWWGKLKEIGHLGDPDVDGSTILTFWRRIFFKILAHPVFKI
jgi:hypothetical protein